MEDKQDFEKIRQYYRIKYPHFYRPKIKIRGEDNENDVVELSERGVRFNYQGTRQLSKGSGLHVTIIFYDGETFQLAGELLRVENKDIILRFSSSLPLSRIMKEQIYLITRSAGHLEIV
jgi:hypothetical protein